MNDFIREVIIGFILSWQIKGRPFLTSFLKGYYAGFLALVLLTLVSLVNNEPVLENLKRDIIIFFIFGTIISTVLMIWTYINRPSHSNQK